MLKAITLLFLLFTATAVYCQTSKNKIIGRYSDDITELILNPDSSFELKTPDYVFPYTYKVYQNSGTWTGSGNVLTLNPGNAKRQANLSLTEKVIECNDSIEIKINYLTEVYENEIIVDETPAEFNLLTLYINDPKNYRNLVHAPVNRNCSFSSKVKKQVVTDSLNIIKLPKQRIERLGIYTYGFDKTIELNSVNPNANYFEITIVQPVDKERTPRSKKLIIKGDYAYFYEVNGKIPTSGLLLNGLKRTE